MRRFILKEKFSIGKDQYEFYNEQEELVYLVKGKLFTFKDILMVKDADKQDLAKVTNDEEKKTKWTVSDLDGSPISNLEFLRTKESKYDAGIKVNIDQQELITEGAGEGKKVRAKGFHMKFMENEELAFEIIKFKSETKDDERLQDEYEIKIHGDINDLVPITSAVIIDGRYFEDDDELEDFVEDKLEDMAKGVKDFVGSKFKKNKEDD